jgi:hypothetical protein
MNFMGSLKKLRSAAAVLAAAALLFAFQTGAWADSNPSNDTDDIEITITPNIDRGVSIDTNNVAMDLGSVDMNASTQTVRPATVTIQGTVTNTELELSAQISGGWSFEPVATSSTTDQLKVWAVFTATTVFTVPAKNNNTFDDTNDFLGASGTSFPATRVGSASGGNGNINNSFEDNSGNTFADMDALRPGMKRHLWLYFTTPPLTSTANPQSIRFYLTVKQGT